MRQLPFSFQLLNFKQQGSYVFHGHSIWLILNGSIKIAGESSFTMERKDIAFFDSGEQIMVVPPFENSILALNLEPGRFRDNMGTANPVVTCNSARMPGDYGELTGLLSRFAEAYFTRTDANWLGLMSQYYQLLGVLSGYVRNHNGADIPQTGGKNDRTQSIEQYIQANYREAITLKDLADHLYLSPTYLSKYFTKHFGVNFYTYLQNVRLDNAVKSLLIEKVSVTKAALDNGFSNISAFATVFKRKYNMQPTKYIHMLEEQNADASSDAVQELEYTMVRKDLRQMLGEGEHQGGDTVLPEENLIYVEGKACVKNQRELRDTWREIINLGEASFCLNNSFQKQLTEAQSVLRFRYGRITGVFDILMARDGQRPDPEWMNYSDFDRVITFMLSVGLKPFLELGRKPQKLDPEPDGYVVSYGSDIQLDPVTWQMLLRKLILHCANYWGADEVASWRFEAWLPQTEELTLCRGRFDRYIQMFKIARDTIHEVVPGACVGGPGINLGAISVFGSLGELFGEMVKAKVTPDFISVYLYPSCDAQTDYTDGRPRVRIKTLLNTKGESNRRKLKNLRSVAQKFFPEVPIWVTELGSDALSRATVNETCYKSAFIVKSAIDLWDKTDAMGYWQFSDLTQEHPDSKRIVFGGNGLISRHGIRKSGFFAFWFLGKLGGGMVDRGENYIVTSTQSDRYALLVHNYKDLSDLYCSEYFKQDIVVPGDKLFADIRPMRFKYTLEDMTPGRYAVKKYTLGAKHGNLADLASELNCWELAKNEDIEYMKNVCVPKQKIMYHDCGGVLELAAELDAQETVLFTLERIYKTE